MSTAEIVPIALVLDGRTGFTLWAPPWEEDGEEWQAFLGADDKILLFGSPGQLAQFLRTGAEHDLSDHPDWEEWADADPFDLAPDDDHTFDLDGVYEIVASAPDRWSVEDLGRTLGIVDAIAQCCDEDIVAPVSDTPELSLVGDGPAAFTGRGGDRAWDKVALAISGRWETVCERVGEFLDWREVVDLDDDIAAAQQEIDAAIIPIDDPDALIAAEGEAADRSDEPIDLIDLDDEDDEDDDAAEDDEDENDAVEDDDIDPEASLAKDDRRPDELDADDDGDEDDAEEDGVQGSGARDGQEEAAYRFWEEAGIMPVRVVFPKEDFAGAEAYTLRCYVDDSPVFLGSSGKPWLFTNPDLLLDTIEDDEGNNADAAGHDLRALATWGSVVNGVAQDDMPLAIVDEDDVDIEAADAMLRGEVDLDAEVFGQACDLLADLAEYGELEQTSDLLDGEGELAGVISSVQDGIEQLEGDLDAAIEQWESVLAEVFSIIDWME